MNKKDLQEITDAIESELKKNEAQRKADEVRSKLEAVMVEIEEILLSEEKVSQKEVEEKINNHIKQRNNWGMGELLMQDEVDTIVDKFVENREEKKEATELMSKEDIEKLLDALNKRQWL